MKQFLTILTLFISSFAIGQVTMRTPGTTTVTDGKLITVQSFAVPKTTLGGNLNGGIPDSLGYIVLSKGDSSVYVYYDINKWRKIGNDSAYVRARFDTSARTLTLYRINKDSTVLLIPAGSGSGSGATDYSWSVVGNTVSQLWNNGANHSFDKSDSRITTQMVTNINTIPNGGETLQSVTTRGNTTTQGMTLNTAGTYMQVLNNARFRAENASGRGADIYISPTAPLSSVLITPDNFPGSGVSTLTIGARDTSITWQYNPLGSKYYMLHQGNLRAGTGVTLDTNGRGVTINATGILSLTAGSGISIIGSPNSTITNTGVTSLTATTPIIASASTGSIGLSFATSGITAGTYPKATYNAFGLATSGSNLNMSDITTGLGYTPYNPAAYPVNLGGETLQSVTTRGNTASNIIRITDSLNIPPSGIGIELGYVMSAYGYIQTVNRNISKLSSTRVIGGGGVSGAKNYIQVDSTLNYNGNLVWYTGNVIGGTGINVTNQTITNTGVTSLNGSTGAVTFNPTLQTVTTNGNSTSNIIRTTGASLIPVSGTGLELLATGSPTRGLIQVPNRDNSTFNAVTIVGSNQTSTQHVLSVSNTLTFDANEVFNTGNIVRGTGIGGTGLTITNTGVTSLNGNTGALTMDTTYISNFSQKVRSLFSAGTGISYNNANGLISNTGTLQTTTNNGNTTNNLLVVSGNNNIPVSGTALEIGYNVGSFGYMQPINRATGFTQSLRLIGGKTNSSGSNYIQIDSTFNYNGNLVWYTGNVIGGTGINVTNQTITNTGVTSLQGSTGAVTLTAGSGVGITGTTISMTAGLATVLANGNTAANNIILGSAASGTQNRFEVDRLLSSQSYAATMQVGTISTVNGGIFRSDNASTSATTYLIAQPGSGWAQSTNGTSLSYLLNQSNVTSTNSFVTLAFGSNGMQITAANQNPFSAPVAVSTTSSICPSNHWSNYMVDATSGNITVTIGMDCIISGDIINVKKVDASANTVTITLDNTGTGGRIDGATTRVISTTQQNIQMVKDGTGMRIL